MAALVVLLTVLCWGALPSWAATSSAAKAREQRTKLRQIQEAIERQKEAVRKTEAAEGNTMEKLAAIESRIAKFKRELQVYKLNLERNQAEKRKVESDLKKLSSQFLEKEAQFKDRLRALYKQGHDFTSQAAFTGSDWMDLLTRIKYLRAVLQRDRERMVKFAAQRTVLETSQDRLRRLETSILAYQKKAAEAQRQMAEERAEKSRLLAKIRLTKAGQVQAQKELESTAQRLQKLIQELERRQASLRPRNGQRGKTEPVGRGTLPWPVSGEVSAFFGKTLHPKYDVYTFNKGIDIAAASGSSIRTVAGGEVLYANELKGYGNILIIDHGNSLYSIYGHLAQILVKVGDQVSGGQPIARLGHGNSESDPTLYFEIRRQGKPEDPLNWLKKAP
ncbi:MAG: peptidoglycan DD-metalloendopeptidase family protein [Candidatus Tectomicrobia bacterium]|uniref:Peptidoglycan DD-metalloendopeptidase family protein n=1 Tax=Tectimicrobiota bacterium TaxID=2528274 RepID=A0A932M0V1_UNCTE|nr:peptidoglycan DD-metalloendopeptidase family protein [Candidatus Tectomicrobia bacterium]